MAKATKKTTFESKLWQMADALRGGMDAAEYKHFVLGLIVLKYISDAFEAKHAELEAQKSEGANPEDPDEYRAASIFRVPKEARLAAIERDNTSLKGVLPKAYTRPGLDKQRLGQLINLVSDIALGAPPTAPQLDGVEIRRARSDGPCSDCVCW